MALCCEKKRKKNRGTGCYGGVVDVDSGIVRWARKAGM